MGVTGKRRVLAAVPNRENDEGSHGYGLRNQSNLCDQRPLVRSLAFTRAHKCVDWVSAVDLV